MKFFLLKILAASFIFSTIILPPGPIQAQVEMDELMDDVLQGIQQETRHSIQQQVKSETQEVLAEERVIPSLGLSGLYTGTDEDDGSDILCNFNFTGNVFNGTCTSSEDNNRVEVSGTVSGNQINFNFTIFELNPTCTGQGTGSGTLTGGGEPGTALHITVSDTPCDTSGEGADSFTLIKS